MVEQRSRVLITETIEKFGYDPRNLTPSSHKVVYVECQGEYCNHSKRTIVFYNYNSFCKLCGAVSSGLKISPNVILQIREELKDPRMKQNYLAKKYKLNIGTIRNIKSGKNFSYIK